ncbi:MAG: ECF-type sigma factor, partial [Planctomycetota bacterium]
EVARRMLGASGAQDLPSRSDFYADLAQSLRRMLRQETATGFSQTASLALTPLELDQPARPAVLSGVLDRLEEKSSRHAQIVILRLLGGMTTAEIAEQMGLPAARIATGWETAREWLLRWLAHQDQTETTLPPQA